jgi:hypothetical protein
LGGFFNFLSQSSSHLNSKEKKHRYCHHAPESFHAACRPDIANDVDNFAVFHHTDCLGIDMGNVDRIVGGDDHRASRFGNEFIPLFDKLAGLIEYLDAIVFGIGHDNAVLRIHHHGMRQIELAGLGTFDATDNLDELPVF